MGMVRRGGNIWRSALAFGGERTKHFRVPRVGGQCSFGTTGQLHRRVYVCWQPVGARQTLRVGLPESCLPSSTSCKAKHAVKNMNIHKYTYVYVNENEKYEE